MSNDSLHGGDLMLGQAISRFKEEFSCDPTVGVFAPGRVNLIGEHVDYVHGFVMPFCLPFRTIIVGCKAPPSAAGRSTIVTCNICGDDSRTSFTIDDSLCKGQPAWANYVKGTIAQYLADLPTGCAFNCTIYSDVPIGAGLSSSAALEVATATFLEQLYSIPTADKQKSGVRKALRCQQAEHTFADMPCGVMDQYVSALGQANNLLLLDCRTNTFELITMGGEPADKPVLLVCNSNVKHTLSGSEYPDRVRQCAEALSCIQRMHPEVQSLRDATLEQLQEANSAGHRSEVPVDQHLLRAMKRKQKRSTNDLREDERKEAESGLSRAAYTRAHHVITENIRTLDAVDAILVGDYEKVGVAMTASHRSLQFDFEVSCEELDLLVRSALQVEGVFGSRMTGGGFGGCTVTLVNAAAVEMLVQVLQHNYPLCECFIVQPSAGAGTLDLASATTVNALTSRYGDADGGEGDDDSLVADSDSEASICDSHWLRWAAASEDALFFLSESPWAATTAAVAVAVIIGGFVMARRR